MDKREGGDATERGPPNDEAGTRQSGPAARRSWKRWLPLAILVCGAIAFFALGLHRYISFKKLHAHHADLMAWVVDWGLMAAVVLTAGYAAMTAFSIPGGALASIVVGYLFGIVGGSVIVLVGATLGATAVFLAARTALGDILIKRARGALKRMEEGFRRDALSYLLVLRLVPLFPFWLVNLVPAFLGVPLRTFVIGTAIGIIPGTVVYVSVGSGLGALLEKGQSPDLKIIFQPEILLPILGLAVLALLPVAYRWWRGRPKDPA
ncbi:MAG: TVP38/TMEM64 family protein [Bauldia litoralis]